MNIVIVCDWAYAGGGAEKVAVDTAIGLRHAGHTVHFIAAVGPAAPGLQQAGVVLHLTGERELRHKGMADLLGSGLWSGRAKALTASVLAALPLGETVVHIHAWQRALTAACLQACEQSGHPMVLTAHEYGSACPNQGFFDYQRQEICERTALGLDCLTTHCDTRTYAHKLWRTARVALQRKAAGFPDSVGDVIFLSELSRGVLSPYFHARTRWHGVRNPMALVQAPRVAAELNQSILFVGRLSFEKGPDIFCRALAATGLPGVVVGDGPMGDALRAQHGSLRYAGWCDADGVRKELQAAKALVLPSRWYEGQPLVVQEALSMGVPVLVSDRTGAREAVQHGVTGLHFRHMDEAALAQALLSLADSAAVRQMSEQAYQQFWQAPQTMHTHCAELTGVYAGALSAKQAQKVAA